MNSKEYLAIGNAYKKVYAEETLQEKQKDTPDQVKAVIAYDKARKGTEDAVYDTEHGDKKQAKKEKDYAKWQRDKGAEDAQKSGHPWEHAKGSTREKEGKKSEKHAHIKDSYDNQIHSTAIAGYANAYQAVYENWSGNEQNELATKEIKDLQKAAKTGKGKYVAKADKVAESVGSAIDKGLGAVGDVAKVGAKAAVGAAKGAVGAVKIGSKVVKGTAKAAGRVVGTPIGAAKAAKKGFQSGSQSESVEIESLINSGIFSEEEITKIVEANRLGKFEDWIEFDEGYQRDPERGEREDTRSARQKRMDDPHKGINSPAFRKFMADKDKGSSAKKSAPAKSKPNPQGTLHLSPDERKKREAKRREDLYKRSADMRRDQKKRGVGVYAKGAKNPGADMDKKLGI